MTTRETLAGLAMAGLLADHKDHCDERQPGESCPDAVARLAVLHADSLIRRLREKSKKTYANLVGIGYDPKHDYFSRVRVNPVEEKPKPCRRKQKKH